MKESCTGIIEEYEITPYTLMVMPINYGSKIYSRIIELEDEFISPFKPLDIIKKSCEYFGSSYGGRKDGTKQLINITHKAPIAIDPTSSIFFFPTTSPLRPQCTWLSHEHVVSFTRLDSKQTTITFRNRKSFDIDVSSSSFENQLHRTSFLKSKLIQRIEETKRKSFYLFTESDGLKASEMISKYPSLK
ncbi:competence protein ComK [Peribacillus sp. NPDC097675]|uniref:competence protein ComK n=1 Tax=Peribacillus sp. NPDC097675 TaxID=3390618 RepID=UPI003D0854CB